ncbi:MAG TPA: hypothetical protein VHN74_08310 [Candidatus Angelobacter sp.]|jgi:hypothetical protein|nr:hypothetical protein [Candidatus Angelobacter sp.]
MRRLTAFLCILLFLVFAGVEATHSHPETAFGGSSGHCAICVSVHANAPVATFHALPVLLAMEMVTVPLDSHGHSALQELSLFIRPPPLA